VAISPGDGGYPNESIGVVALHDGKYNVVEYSEISTTQAEARESAMGELLFRAGNIANHFYTTAFLRGVAAFKDDLAFHTARKKIPHVSLPDGAPIKPAKPNGMKLELLECGRGARCAGSVIGRE